MGVRLEKGKKKFFLRGIIKREKKGMGQTVLVPVVKEFNILGLYSCGET